MRRSLEADGLIRFDSDLKTNDENFRSAKKVKEKKYVTEINKKGL